MAIKNQNNTRLTNTVRKQVAMAFREILSDPDAGLSLQPAVETRLRKSIASAKKGRTRSFSEVLRQYSL